MSPQLRLAGRLALVTGASRGIGRAAALALAREGAHVILLARTTGALEEVDDEIRGFGGSATLVALDLRKADKVDALGPTIYQRWGKLDVLIGNAATLGPMSPLGHVTADAWTMTLDINLTANWRLIRTLDPVLRRSGTGRALFVSSAAAHQANAYMGPYAVSKAALEMLVRTYAAETSDTGVCANLIDPGPVRTLMRAKAFPGEDAAKLTAPEALGPMFVELAAAECTANGQVFRFADWRKQGRPAG